MKKSTSYTEQINKYKERGMIISDEEFAKDVLSRINYYYISGYLYDYRQKDMYGNLKEEYIENLSFEKIYNIIIFDMKLRAIILYILDMIESHLKAKLGHFSAETHGPQGYLDSKNFTCRKTHQKTINNFEIQKSNNKHLPFIKHHLYNKNEKIPIWVAIHIYNFGMLSYFYSNMKTQDRKSIAKEFNIKHIILESWIKYFNYIRNLAAHNMRLYNFKLQYSPKTKGMSNFSTTYKIFDFFYIAKFFISERIWAEDILFQLEDLIDQYNSHIELDSIGFPNDWKNILSSKNKEV